MTHFHIQSGALSYVPTRKNDIPPDCADEFAVPLRADRCCVVVRLQYGVACAPRRCGGRRQCFNPLDTSKSRLTCVAHKKREADALAWRKGLI